MKRILLLVGITAVWVVLPPPMAATPDGEVPLKILSEIPEFEERVLPPPKGFPEPDPRIYRVSLRNDSEKIITAWRFSCLFATNEGRHGTVSLEEDGFRAFEWMTDERPPGNGLFMPGAILDLEVPANSETVSGPYGAVACRVDTVIFADASFAGDAMAANRIFEARRREAAGAARGIELITAALETGTAEKSPAENALEAIRDAVVAEKEPYFRVLTEALDSPESNENETDASEVLTDLLVFLRKDLELIKRHLPGRQGSEKCKRLKESL